MIFLDAGPLIAFFNHRDNYHRQAVDTFKMLYQNNNTLITTNRVVSEVYDAIRYDRRISSKKDAKPALLIFDALAKSENYINIEFIPKEIEDSAVTILKTYSDQNFSFCDACSFAFIEKLKLSQIYTFDLTDFRIFKFPRKPTFVS